MTDPLSISRIPKNDPRYQILSTIPEKEYDDQQNIVYVYLYISRTKDYFMTYRPYQIQLQTFVYIDYEPRSVCDVEITSQIICIDGFEYVIE
jgi:hypothetical protein